MDLAIIERGRPGHLVRALAVFTQEALATLAALQRVVEGGAKGQRGAVTHASKGGGRR